MKKIHLGVVLAVIFACGKSSPVGPSTTDATLFSDSFASYPNGLITNEYAYWNHSDPSAKQSSRWELTSGSLFALNGEGYTGVPDTVGPNALSTNGTNSAVFRLTTKQPNFGNVTVSFDLLNVGLVETRSTPRMGLDGVHIFLRYQNEESLYYASVNRRDNTTVIKKKVPGGPSNNGTYYDLTSYVPNSVPYGAWQSVAASIKTNRDSSVTIEVFSQGQKIVSATDNGTIGGPPITFSGKVGIRGDNAEFRFKNFVVKAL